MVKHEHLKNIIFLRKRKTRIILILKISLLLLITITFCIYNNLTINHEARTNDASSKEIGKVFSFIDSYIPVQY